jgi:stage V sporulation protein AB
MVQKAKLEHKVIYIENIVCRGILFGTVLSLFSWRKKWLFELLGKTLLTIFGMSAGIFVGCLSVALAEILDTFPIFFRRTHLEEKNGEILLFVMAMGKMIGSLFFFLMGYDIIVP